VRTDLESSNELIARASTRRGELGIREREQREWLKIPGGAEFKLGRLWHQPR
jgi:hypothetical protein